MRTGILTHAAHTCCQSWRLQVRFKGSIDIWLPLKKALITSDKHDENGVDDNNFVVSENDGDNDDDGLDDDDDSNYDIFAADGYYMLMIMVINNAFVPLTSSLDIDECQTKSCPDNSICKNTPGNFTCTCKEGYAGKTCSGKSLQIHFQTLDIKFTNDEDC